MSDWLPELNDDDLGILMDALEAWEHKDDAGAMFGDVMELIAAPRDAEARAQLREQRAMDSIRRREETKARKEQSVLLRAKILTLRERRRSGKSLH